MIPNTGTPSYVVNDPSFQSVTCATRGTIATYPIYYSPGYKNNYKTFLAALLSRYGSDPRIGYIRTGLSRGGEVFPSCLTQMMQSSGTSLSQFNNIWQDYVAEITAFQQGIPHTVQLMAALDQYGWPTQFAVCDWEANNAVSLGFGFGSQGLQLSDTLYPGGQCSADWCAMFQTYQGRVPLELQTISASDPSNLQGGTGSLTVLLPFGLSLGAQVFEIYVQDWQIAYDPTSPNYASYGGVYQAVFQQTQVALGY